MPDINFFLLRQQKIHAFIKRPPPDLLDHAACKGVEVGAYHPEVGRPRKADLFRCETCVANVACLAIALRAEDPDVRVGWYGGIGPTDRADLAAHLGLVTIEPVLPQGAVEAIRLFRTGWTVNAIAAELGCCRRTVQRYLRMAA